MPRDWRDATLRDLLAQYRARVYPFGAVWHWKCTRADCGCGGRSRTLPGAYDGALGHIREAHRPIVRLRLYRRTGARVWVASLGPYALGHVIERQPGGYAPAWHGPVVNQFIPRASYPYASRSMDTAVYRLLEDHDIDVNWFTSASGRIEVEDGRRATMIASAGPAAGGGGRGEAE
jgi:hypothetical protein